MTPKKQIISFVFFLSVGLLSHSEGKQNMLIDGRSSLPDDEREYYSRYVNFRPGNGQTVELNPPRFSWPYLADIVPKSNKVPLGQLFTLQISKAEDFRELEVDVQNVPYNFYNMLSPLPDAGTWFWRVGYNVGTDKEAWSDVRSFTISPSAVRWDRSFLAEPNLASIGHPRILFNPDNIDEIRALRLNHPESTRIAEKIREQADQIIKTHWWKNFPETDRINPDVVGELYSIMSEEMVLVAFAYILFEDKKYFGCKERFLTIASWEKGGWSSPEGITGIGLEIKGGPFEERTTGADEDATKTSEHLALFFDWFYNDLNLGERETVIKSLEWRLDHSVNNHHWRGNKNADRPGIMSASSIALISKSHQFEGTMDNLPVSLALYEHSHIAREAFERSVNYLIGVTNGFGPEEAWNEGSGYGNSKMKWLLNATIIFDSVFPKLQLAKNPYYRTIGDFFIHLAPVGLQHSSFGNGAIGQYRLHENRIMNFRRLAYLTGDSKFLKNQQESLKMFPVPDFRLWTEYVLPYYYKEPKEKEETATSIANYRLSKLAGWVTANSGNPNSYDDYQNSVGMLFHCRPRGGYSHSFFNENAFDIHAYGEVITHGGASTANKDAFADQTMSHNSILIDGKGQKQTLYFPLARKKEGYRRLPFKRVGYIAAFDQSDDYVYWVGDATNAYAESAPYLERFRRHVLFVNERYFVLFDELRTDPDHAPSTFTWLYHIYPDLEVEFDAKKFEYNYQINRAKVKVRHIADEGALSFENRNGRDNYINPITGEDYSKFENFEGKMFHNNIWVSTTAPTNETHFLTVIFPFEETTSEPVITRLDNKTVKVTYGDSEDIISFDINSPHNPDITIDYKSIK